MPDFTTLLQGNNLVYIILAVLAYFVLMGKKDPTPTPVTPVDPNNPPVPAPVTPTERPLIDLFIKIVPILLKQQAEEKAAAAKEDAPK